MANVNMTLTCSDCYRLVPNCKRRRGPVAASKIALTTLSICASATGWPIGYIDDLYCHGRKSYDSLGQLERHFGTDCCNELLAILIEEDKEAGCFCCDCDNCKREDPCKRI